MEVSRIYYIVSCGIVAQGFTLDVSDMIIAATAEANHCILVTANENDFRKVPFFNPMAS